MNQTSDIPEQAIRTMQIITGALVSGVVFLTAIAVFALGALDEPPSGQLISLLGAVMAVFAFGAHLVVPRVIAQQALANIDASDARALCGVYQTQLIIGLALLEGMACFNVVTCIIEHNWWSLAVAGALVLWMLIAFPTRTRVEQWIETQRMQHQH